MLITTTEYTLGSAPVTGEGLAVSDHSLDESLAGPVSAAVFDDEGHSAIEALLEGVADTEFAQDTLSALLGDAREPEAWRVGEALAETYLSIHQNCNFPWPDGRDERKRSSSLPGADLVGFQREGEQERFAFGEVKTSGEQSYPPGAVYGRHGLKQQLEDLKDCRTIRDDLVKYLGHRAVSATWRGRYQAAASVYLRDPSEVRIFGILVRDVAPHEDDLRARVSSLEKDCPPATAIGLFALYLPIGRIANLGRQVMQYQELGGDS
jgi:hypothetical protein